MSRGSGGRQAGMRREIGFVAAVLYAALICGCAQNTKAPQVQPATNESRTAQDSDQRSAGSMTNIYVINRPGPGVEGEYKTSLGGGAVARAAKLGTGQAAESGAGLGDGEATYQQSAISINVSYGNVAATATPTGGSATGTVTPTQSGTWSPHQEPKATVTTPIAVGLPGSAPTATGSGSVEGPATTTANPQNDLKTLIAKASGGDPAALQQLQQLQALWQLLAPAGPTSQPSP